MLVSVRASSTTILSACSLLVLSSLSLHCGGAPSSGNRMDAAIDGSDASTDAVSEASTDAVAVDTFFDPGLAPSCAVSTAFRRVIERPGGARPSAPAGLLRTNTGFLTVARRVDYASAPDPDAGMTLPPTTRDSVEVFALGNDGTLNGSPISLYDAVPERAAIDLPVVTPAMDGAFVAFQEFRGVANEPDYLLRLRSARIDARGNGMLTTLRERYARPTMTTLNDGSILALSSRVEAVLDAGVVTLPVLLRLRPDGSNSATDLDLNAQIPADARDTLLRPCADGGAVLLWRENATLGFLRFSSAGVVVAPGARTVAGATMPALEDGACTHDAVYASRSITLRDGTTEVHAVVASLNGMLRSQPRLEQYMGEGSATTTMVPAFGGVAVLWRRGLAMNSRVRIAVLSPNGVVRVAARDLLPAPGIDGKIAATVSNGRELSLLGRIGASSNDWGFGFAQACVPAM